MVHTIRTKKSRKYQKQIVPKVKPNLLHIHFDFVHFSSQYLTYFIVLYFEIQHNIFTNYPSSFSSCITKISKSKFSHFAQLCALINSFIHTLSGCKKLVEVNQSWSGHFGQIFLNQREEFMSRNTGWFLPLVPLTNYNISIVVLHMFNSLKVVMSSKDTKWKIVIIFLLTPFNLDLGSLTPLVPSDCWCFASFCHEPSSWNATVAPISMATLLPLTSVPPLHSQWELEGEKWEPWHSEILLCNSQGDVIWVITPAKMNTASPGSTNKKKISALSCMLHWRRYQTFIIKASLRRLVSKLLLHHGPSHVAFSGNHIAWMSPSLSDCHRNNGIVMTVLFPKVKFAEVVRWLW